MRPLGKDGRALKTVKINEKPLKLETSNITYGSTHKSGYGKSSVKIKGQSVLKVHAWQCRVTVLYTLSQDTVVLLFLR